MITPKIVDLYHGDSVEGPDCMAGFQKARAAGILGVIHKASQGASYKDPAYDIRRHAAQTLGLQWAAYHFNTGDEIADQVINFLDAAQPDQFTGMWLDFEDYNRGNMSVHEAVSFMKLVEDRIGRQCGLYSGNRIKETIKLLSSNEYDYMISHPLWLCQYSSKFVLPPGYTKYYLWQYTGDGLGPLPHVVDGISVSGGNGIDLNVFDGTIDDLKATWAGMPLEPLVS